MTSWLDVLKIVSKLDDVFYLKDVMAEFDGMVYGEVSARITRLRQWGFVRYADRKKRGWGGYVVTSYGIGRLEKEEK